MFVNLRDFCTDCSTFRKNCKNGAHLKKALKTRTYEE